jgi:predicted nucleic acid-binding protein
MPLDVPAGQTVFLDSTILHYAVVDFPGGTPRCIELLKRVTNREVAACFTAPVLNDAIHKIMCSEAAERFDQPRAGLVNWLKANPARVRELTHAAEALRLFEAIPTGLLPVDWAALSDAQRTAQAYGLLASDALIVAMMQRHGIRDLATNDDDFDGIPDLTIWKPRPA